MQRATRKQANIGDEIIRTKVDSGACDLVIGPEVAVGHPLTETEASKRGIAYVSASGGPMPDRGEWKLLVKRPCVKLSSMQNNSTNCIRSSTAVI